MAQDSKGFDLELTLRIDDPSIAAAIEKTLTNAQKIVDSKGIVIKLSGNQEELNKQLKAIQDKHFEIGKNISFQFDHSKINKEFENLKNLANKSADEVGSILEKGFSKISTKDFLKGLNQKQYREEMKSLTSSMMSGDFFKGKNYEEILAAIKKVDQLRQIMYDKNRPSRFSVDYRNDAEGALKNAYNYLAANNSTLQNQLQQQYDAVVAKEKEILNRMSSKTKSQGSLSSETKSFAPLAEQIEKVISAVNQKTEAFKTEETVVGKTVSEEINALKSLESVLQSIKTSIEGLGTIKISASSKGFKNLTEALTDFQTKLSGMNFSDENNILGYINGLLAKKDELKSLAAILSNNISTIQAAGSQLNNGQNNTSNDRYKTSLREVLNSLQEIHKINKTLSNSNSKEVLSEAEINDLLNRRKQLYSQIKQNYLSNATNILAEIDARGELTQKEEKYISLIREEQNFRQAGVLSIEEQLNLLKMLEAEYKKYLSDQKKAVNGIVISPSEQARINNLGYFYDGIANDSIPLFDSDDPKVKKSYDALKNYMKAAGSVSQTKIISPIGETIPNEYITNAEQFVNTVNKLASAEGKIKSIQGSAIVPIKGSSNLYQMTAQIEDMTGALRMLQYQWDTSASTISVSTTKMGASTNWLSRMIDGVSKKAGQLATYWVAMYVNPFTVLAKIKEGINIVKELDNELVDLRKTTTMSMKELNEFYYQSPIIAKQMGVTTKEIISQASAWSRLGYSSKEAAIEMGKMSSKFASISPGMNTDEAQEGLVSIMKAFDIQVDDVESRIMDKINILGNKFAETNGDVVTGLKQSSAAMSAMGESFESTAALFTGGMEILQDASQMGAGLRTIAMRVRGYSEETGELDETLKNIKGDVLDLTKTANHKEGVSLFTDATQTQYRSMVDYLGDIADRWDEIDEKSKTQILQKLFAKTRANVGSAILKNFDQVRAALEEMESAAGSADREMDIIQTSIDYKMNAFGETWTEWVQKIMDRGDLGVIIDGLTRLSEVFVSLTGNLNIFSGVVMGLFAYLSAKKNFGRAKTFALKC